MREAARPESLLEWYDLHARDLPWRIGPAARRAGLRPDPYRVWLSEVMLQQTTVAAVAGYFERFTSLWPDVHALADADDDRVMARWAGLGYYARARNLLRCARIVSRELGGSFPSSAAALRALPGIGPYTAAAIAAIAFDCPETVVDGNVERVMARLRCEPTPLPAAKKRLAAHAAELTPRSRPGDYAQAVMDLGATICTPRSPSCGTCPWQGACVARRQGVQAELPRRAPKVAKPVRHGIAWLGRREDGAWLLERRPESGLLGGMFGWPGTGWGHEPDGSAPVQASWQPAGEVRHTFTHFHLRLELRVAHLPRATAPDRGVFVPAPAFRPADLPTLMRKAHALAEARLREIDAGAVRCG